MEQEVNPYSLDLRDVLPNAPTTTTDPPVEQRTGEGWLEESVGPPGTKIEEITADDAATEAQAEKSEPEQLELPKVEPAKKPEPEPRDIRKINGQLRALDRKQKAFEKREFEIAQRAERLRELEDLDSLDEFGLLARVAERKGLTVSDLIRHGIQRAAGHTPEPEQPKPELEALRRVEKLERDLREREAQVIAHQDASMLDGYQSAILAAADVEKFPGLALFDQEEYLSQALDAADEYSRRTGGGLADPSELAQFLNARAEEKLARVQSTKKPAAPTPAAPAKTPTPDTVDPNYDSSVPTFAMPFRPRRPTGITNKIAGGDSGPGSTNTHRLDDRARIENAAAWLRGQGKA